MYSKINYLNYPMGGYNMINESRSLIEGNSEWILSLGSIEFEDLKGEMVTVPCREFTKLVDMALGRIESRFSYISPYIMHSKVMYVPYAGGMHETMCVDSHKNLWINMPFVYNALNMDGNKVFAIIFHELMHNVLGHLDKMAEKFPEVKRKSMGEVAWGLESKKINVCADMEVNCDMVADEIVTEDFWDKFGGVYDKDYIGKMWDQIYASSGDELFKRFVLGDDEVGEKTSEVLKAYEEYAEKVSEPEATKRDKTKAKEELEKKLEEILGKDPKKKSKSRTIKDALKKLKGSYIKDIDNIGEILDNLIDIYTINPEEFDDADYSNAISEIDRFERSLMDNASEICSESMHLEERTFKAYVAECMKMFKDNTTTVFEGRKSLSKFEIERLNADTAGALWVLLEDEDAKEKEAKEREKRAEEAKKREEEEKKKKEKEKEKAEEKKKKAERARHPLFMMFKKLANISNLMYVGRISKETSGVTYDMAKTLQTLSDTPIEKITLKDVESVIKSCAEMGRLLEKDLIKLYDDHIVLKKTTSELTKLANDAAEITENALKTVGDEKATISEKRTDALKAVGILNSVGRILSTKKKTKATKEFMKAYKEEMKRLTRVAKKFGKDTIKEHLKDLGYCPETYFEVTGRDVVGTELDPEASKKK